MSKKQVGVLVDTVNNTIVDQYESHEMFLTRRGKQMAGMIGLLSSRLEMICMTLRIEMEYGDTTPEMWRRSAKQIRLESLETLIKYQHEWADMQQYTETDYGMQMYKEKIEEYTTELEALKTLAL